MQVFQGNFLQNLSGEVGLPGIFWTEDVLNQDGERSSITSSSTHNATETSAFNSQRHESGGRGDGQLLAELTSAYFSSPIRIVQMNFANQTIAIAAKHERE